MERSHALIIAATAAALIAGGVWWSITSSDRATRQNLEQFRQDAEQYKQSE